MTIPQPLDFAETWQDYARYNMRERQSEAGEIDFWSRNALGYDAGIKANPESYRETLNAIRS